MENCTPISHTAEVGATIIDQNQISDKNYMLEIRSVIALDVVRKYARKTFYFLSFFVQ